MKNLITHFFTLFLLLSLVHINSSAYGQDTIYSEGFNYTTGVLPPGWVLDAEQPPLWKVNSSAMAGGEAPELALGYSFASGFSRLISPIISIEGYEALRLKYKQYLINYAMDWGEIIGQDVTFDGGLTWQVTWEKAITTLNIPPDTYSYFISVPAGATEMQFAFRFEGNLNGINWWLIDDIVLEPAAGNDMLTAAFTGNTTPVKGVQASYAIDVVNGGKLPQTNYTVKLMKEGGVELASIPGEPISFAEKITYQLSWTPGEENIGNTFLYAIVDLAGDEIPENNQSNNLNVIVQPANISSVEIHTGNVPLDWLPYNFFNLHSMSQTLYFPDEIGVSNAPITGILYTCQFDQDLQDVPIQLWMGETDRNDLTETWVDPSTLTPVFDGAVDFIKGINHLYIPLDSAYTYGGRNLVIYSYKSYTEMVLGTPFFCSLDSNSMRSRLAESDEAFDPMNPTWGYNVDVYPNITLFYSTPETSIDKLNGSSSVILFPNPSNNKLNVRSDQTILEIRMIDILGQEVYKQAVGGKQHQIEVSSLQPGIYLVQVITPYGLTTQKVQVSE